MFVNLLYAEWVPIRRLINYSLAVDRALMWSPAKRQALFTEFGAVGLQHPDPATRSEVTKLLEGPSETTKINLSLFGASLSNKGDMFVADSTIDRALRITPSALHGLSRALRPLDLFEYGRFVVILDLLSSTSTEARMAGNRVFMLKTQVNLLERPRPPGTGEIRKVGKQIRDEYINNNPGRRMAADDFIQSLFRIHHSISRRTAAKIWAEVAPACWKKPGRKS
jgi:hypothetical protein